MEQNTSSGRIKAVFSVTLIAVIAVCVGLWIQLHNKPAQALEPPQLQGGTILSQEVAPAPFDLEATKIGRLSNAKLRGTDKWSLLFFGFTHCKTICPTALAEIKRANDLLKKQKNAVVPQVYFVSVDPERDSVERLQNFLAHFDPSFIGATGSPDAIKAVTEDFGIAYAKATSNQADKKHYDINHSGVVILIDPKGHWLALLNPPLAADKMAKDITLAQKFYRQKYHQQS